MADDQRNLSPLPLKEAAEHALLEMRDRFELKRGDSISLDALEDELQSQMLVEH